MRSQHSICLICDLYFAVKEEPPQARPGPSSGGYHGSPQGWVALFSKLHTSSMEKRIRGDPGHRIVNILLGWDLAKD